MSTRLIKKHVFLFFLTLLLTASGCGRAPEPALAPEVPDLVIFTSQEKEVYEPVIKEYQERSGLSIQVISGTFQDLQERIQEGTLAAECDVVFGISSATLEHHRSSWEPYRSTFAPLLATDFVSSDDTWTPFSALPLVIMYNTKVVTYREVPEGWDSLLEPRWKGRIAFMNPELSDIYATALATAMHASKQSSQYITRFASNLDYRTYTSLSEVNNAIADGRCSLGVTLEALAESLRQEGGDVDYIYPQEGTCALPDGSAIIAGCARPEAAKDFIDFTVSRDVQRILVSDLNRRSVRKDIAPFPGLPPLRQFPILPAAPSQLAGSKYQAMEEWRNLFSAHLDEGR